MSATSAMGKAMLVFRELQDICELNPEDIFSDFKARKSLQALSIRLFRALETPLESLRRIIFQPQQLVAVRIGIENGWFDALVADDQPKTASELSAATGAEEILIIRLMRVLTCNGIVKEVGVNTYQATLVCEALTKPGIYHSIYHFYDEGLPCFVKFPAWLKKNEYRAPSDPKAGPFAEAFGTTQWEYFAKNPERGRSFDIFMTAQREGRVNWLDSYPFNERILAQYERNRGENVLLVDVAGGQGHELQALRKHLGDTPARLVLQDLPHVLGQMEKKQRAVIDDIVEYDFFNPQPIQGARAYYFRSILHDWDDESCRKILRNQTTAMRPGYSTILINDHVLEDMNADFFGVSMDVAMMTLLAGMERTRDQWHLLLASVGLKIVGIHSLEQGGEGIIEAILESHESNGVAHMPSSSPRKQDRKRDRSSSESTEPNSEGEGEGETHQSHKKARLTNGGSESTTASNIGGDLIQVD